MSIFYKNLHEELLTVSNKLDNEPVTIISWSNFWIVLCWQLGAQPINMLQYYSIFRPIIKRSESQHSEVIGTNKWRAEIIGSK